MSDDVLERLRTDPAPAMHVDVATVVAIARQRRRRRQRLATGAGALAAAAVVAATVILPGLAGAPEAVPPGTARTTGSTSPAPATSTPPSNTSSSTPSATPSATDTRSGSVVIRDTGAGCARECSFAVSVARGLMTVRLTQEGRAADPVTARLLPGGATWLVTSSTRAGIAVVGVAPAPAVDVDVTPAPGAPDHAILSAPAGDFVAFVAVYDRPPAMPAPATDVGWGTRGQRTFALGARGDTASMAVPGAGTLEVSMPSRRLGSRVEASLDGAPLRGTVVHGGAPDAVYAYSRHPLPGGRTLFWGLVPWGTLEVRPYLDGGATAGAARLAPLGDHPAFTVFAVVVGGAPEEVSGLEADLPGGLGIGVIE